MRLIHLSYSDIQGGAARAAYRIHHALRAAGINSTMSVSLAAAGDWTATGPSSNLGRLAARARPGLIRAIGRASPAYDPANLSPAVLPSSRLKHINTSDADVIHLHWIAGEMLSIAEIGRIEKPVVWTLHDMWAFCGAEHYTEDNRWREGYTRNRRPRREAWLDFNRWTWARKHKHWRRPMHIVTPSHWLADCVRDSKLMRDWPVTVVPNCLDMERWRPLEQRLARELLGLPTDVPLLLFGAEGGARDPRKGFALLVQALGHLRGEIPGLELVVFGQLAPREAPDLGFPVHYAGTLHDDLSLRALYSAADALALPSRQDNLPNTGIEAQACGTPVVAFDIGGLPDIVTHEHTGYLACPFETEDLAKGIAWVLTQGKSDKLGGNARALAVQRFSNPVVAHLYQAVYADIGESGARELLRNPVRPPLLSARV
jgi:glycosyltransferase involved in cell wall biosynthesis